MTHPDQLFTPKVSTNLQAVQHEVNLRQWRNLDILELLEAFKSIAMQPCTTDQLQALEGLPSSLHTLLLNSVMPLRRLMQQPNDCHDLDGARITNQLPSFAKVNTNDLPPQFKAIAADLPTVKVSTHQARTETLPEAVILPKQELTPITTEQLNTLPAEECDCKDSKPKEYKIIARSFIGGKRWYIGRALVAEVEFIEGLGHVCRKYTGKHLSNQKPYSKYETAASEAIAHASGCLYLLGAV